MEKLQICSKNPSANEFTVNMEVYTQRAEPAHTAIKQLLSKTSSEVNDIYEVLSQLRKLFGQDEYVRGSGALICST